jgi:glycosyltransferase involved in cell wall biosynthesis
MHFYKNPGWIDGRLLTDLKLDRIPQSLFDEINQGLQSFQSDDPLVSIVIPVLNEEVTVLRTLHSLSKNKTSYSVEVIVVNNNSTDRTQEVLDKLNLKSYLQKQPGWGPARQLGQEKAKGKFILMADADCFYPPVWIQKMTNELLKERVTCVYGGYAFLGSRDKARWKFFIYESLRNVVCEIRHVKRPYLNAMGMSMGYIKELGLKKGFINRKIRGEDGRMCFELMQFGKVKRVRSNKITVWTFPRTLQKDGNLLHSIIKRAVVEVARFSSYFSKPPIHDTHTSQNFSPRKLKIFNKHQQPDLEKKTDEVNT